MLNVFASINPGLAGMQKNWGGVLDLGAAMGGELTQFGVHAAFNLGAGHGWDSFGRAFF